MHATPISNERRSNRRRGMFTLELVLALPIVALVVCALVELALMLLCITALGAAASAAAREASLPGASARSVEMMALKALGDRAYARKCEVKALVHTNNSARRSVSSAHGGDMIEVTVCVPARAACPDLLRYIGLSIDGQTLKSTYVVRRE